MKRWAGSFLLIVLVVVFTPDQSSAKVTRHVSPKNFIFIRPDPGPPHPFFDNFEAAMRTAANDLGDHLDVRYANTDHYHMLELIREIAASSSKPDAVIFMAMRNNGQEALNILNDAGVKAFIVNAGLTDDQYQETGQPREKLPQWLGQMLPDDVGAGRNLAQSLYDQSIKANPALIGKGVRMLAIEANAGDSASILRAQGLKEFSDQNSHIEIVQKVKGQWEKTRAYDVTKLALKRYGTLDTIWAASDAMAIGAAQAAIEDGLIPGKTIFIGGVDWSDEGLKDIENGTINASAGGHILEGAWAIVVLHDYFNGHDFKGYEGLKMHSPMYIADKNNLSSIQSRMGEKNWPALNFRSFSKDYNPDIKRYDFTIFLKPNPVR